MISMSNGFKNSEYKAMQPSTKMVKSNKNTLKMDFWKI